MTRNPFVSPSSWTAKTRTLDHVWEPGDIHLELWHEIIDSLGFPQWIREYREHVRHRDARDNANELFTSPVFQVSTERMCSLTHLTWVPIAFLSFDTMISDTYLRQQIHATCCQYLGYFGADLLPGAEHPLSDAAWVLYNDAIQWADSLRVVPTPPELFL